MREKWEGQANDIRLNYRTPPQKILGDTAEISNMVDTTWAPLQTIHNWTAQYSHPCECDMSDKRNVDRLLSNLTSGQFLYQTIIAVQKVQKEWECELTGQMTDDSNYLPDTWGTPTSTRRGLEVFPMKRRRVDGAVLAGKKVEMVPQVVLKWCHFEEGGAVFDLLVGQQLQGWSQNGARGGANTVPLWLRWSRFGSTFFLSAGSHLCQGWTRPLGRTPGRPSMRAAGPRAGSTWSSTSIFSKWNIGNTQLFVAPPEQTNIFCWYPQIAARLGPVRDLAGHAQKFLSNCVRSLSCTSGLPLPAQAPVCPWCPIPIPYRIRTWTLSGLESRISNQTFELTWNRNQNRNHTWVGTVHHWRVILCIL